MLDDARVATRLPTQDLGRARRSSAEKLGLDPTEERPGGLLYRFGNGEFALAAHRLWERARDERMREQVVLFNVATALMLSLGVLCLYLVLFVLSLVATAVVVTPTALAHGIGHHGGSAEYAKLAWMCELGERYLGAAREDVDAT
jgi:hypothetical protein